MELDSQQLVVISIVLENRFYVRAMFAQYYFSLPVNHNTLYHFTFLDILEEDIIRVTNYEW